MADPEPSHDGLYQELRADIRATDDISFKLMGLVPLVSGAAFLTFFLEDKVRAQSRAVLALCLFAALITVVLFRWELRNIQTCNWLRRRSEVMEKTIRPKSPGGFGKTEAEKALYAITSFAWLLMPVVFSPLHEESTVSLACYAIVALFIVCVTVQSIFTSVEVKLSTPSGPEKAIERGAAEKVVAPDREVTRSWLS